MKKSLMTSFILSSFLAVPAFGSNHCNILLEDAESPTQSRFPVKGTGLMKERLEMLANAVVQKNYKIVYDSSLAAVSIRMVATRCEQGFIYTDGERGCDLATSRLVMTDLTNDETYSVVGEDESGFFFDAKNDKAFSNALKEIPKCN